MTASRSGAGIDAETVRTYLALSHLLDEVEPDHPEVTAALRLTLVRSHRRYRAGWLDAGRFREVLLELTDRVGSSGDVDRAPVAAPRLSA